MLSAKPEMLEMFGKWNFNKTVFPRPFLLGNFLMAAGILMILCLELLHKDLKGAAIELPFLALNLLIIYLQHPLSETAST